MKKTIQQSLVFKEENKMIERLFVFCPWHRNDNELSWFISTTVKFTGTANLGLHGSFDEEFEYKQTQNQRTSVHVNVISDNCHFVTQMLN